MALTQEVDLTLAPHQRNTDHGIWDAVNVSELSRAEREYLLEDDRYKLSPAKALKEWDKSVPHNPEPEHRLVSINQWCVDHPGVNPKAIEKLLFRMREVEEVHGDRYGYYRRDELMAQLLNKVGGEEFFGNEAVKVCLEDSLEYERRLDEIRKVSPQSARHPSMYTRDGRGQLHWQGDGTDRGIIRRFIFHILNTDVSAQIDEAWEKAAVPDSTAVVESASPEDEKVSGRGAKYVLIEGDNYFECPVKGCNARQEFDPGNSQDRSMAKARMARHLGTAKKNVGDHREAKVVLFG